MQAAFARKARDVRIETDDKRVVASWVAVRDLGGLCARRICFGESFAAEHIEALPPEIQRKLSARARACGNKAAAAHYFSVSIGTNGQHFISLHFEDFACQNRTTICRGGLCLHEVYLQSRAGPRLVFSAHARDLKMVDDDDTIGLEVSGTPFEADTDGTADISSV